MPVWHASVALQSRNGPRPVEALKRQQIHKGIKIASALLVGVGGDRIVFTTDPPRDAIHVQKPLTVEEIEGLPDGWMQIAAIDERGTYRILRV
jgi:hypothetical protein